MVDWFKGKPWELSKFPPKDRSEFLEWLSHYQWPDLEPNFLKTIGYLREYGAKKIGPPPASPQKIPAH